MIESINNNGGGGGGVQTITAGAGISVDATDPENVIVASTIADTDEKVRVSANDTTPGYLNGKLVAGTGIGFTENNNGSNETLTVAIGNHDASLITSGTIATARLGTGTANSSTYLAGDQTYKAAVTSVNGSTGAVTVASTVHTHAASDITTGTIATARLGTGTANSSTYLAGDQTYKAAVTSVNGSTGAVIVAAGDTTYALTILDAENTTTARDVVSFTIAGGTLLDGEIISIDTVTDGLNNSGSTASLTSRMVVNGTAQPLQTSSWTTTSLVWQDKQRVNIWRDGSTLWVGNPTTWAAPTTEGFVMRVQNSFYATGFASSTTPNFSNAITIALRLQWNLANASTYIRIRNARVVKQSGQYT